jgi:Rieske Fe-S protein
MKRRTAAGILVAGGALVAAGAVGVPTLVMGLSPALRSRRENWQPLGPVDDFAAEGITSSVIEPHQGTWPQRHGQHLVYVWRRKTDEFVVFSRSCTDLGCPVEYDRRSACFYCPCHGGIFDREGERLAGPPRRPLYRYDHRVRDGVLEIDLSSIPPSA